MRRLCLAVFLLALPVSGCSVVFPRHEAAQAPFVHHVSYAGENFGRIAKWYSGDYENWSTIAGDNPQISPKHLKIGDEIRVRASLLKRNTPMPESFVRATTKTPGSASLSASAKNETSIKSPVKKALIANKTTKGSIVAENKAKKASSVKLAMKERTDLRDSRRALAPEIAPQKRSEPMLIARKDIPEPAAAVDVSAPASPSAVEAPHDEDPASSYTCRKQSCTKGGVSASSEEHDASIKEVETDNHGGNS